jgi:hypothetical protein
MRIMEGKMRNTWQAKFAGIALVCLLILGIQTIASAQGRGRGGGGGGGRPAGVGGGMSSRSPGVDRGLGTASDRSRGRSDRGLETASGKSGGRSDEGLARARRARENSRHADEEISEHPGLARRLNLSHDELRRRYETALLNNPDLKFGQFVAANMLGRNLGRRNADITTEAILDGLADGKSIGRTLQDLGLSSREAKDAERNAAREIKEIKKRS